MAFETEFGENTFLNLCQKVFDANRTQAEFVNSVASCKVKFCD